MRLETLPLVLGALVALIGLGLVLDALAADTVVSERRRRPRRPRDRFGEFLVGLGVLALAAALVGRDAWRYSTVTVIAGSVLLLLGVWSNSGYLKDLFRRSRPPKPEPGPRRIR
jgi:hypothetical protein